MATSVDPTYPWIRIVDGRRVLPPHLAVEFVARVTAQFGFLDGLGFERARCRNYTRVSGGMVTYWRRPIVVRIAGSFGPKLHLRVWLNSDVPDLACRIVGPDDVRGDTLHAEYVVLTAQDLVWHLDPCLTRAEADRRGGAQLGWIDTPAELDEAAARLASFLRQFEDEIADPERVAAIVDEVLARDFDRHDSEVAAEIRRAAADAFREGDWSSTVLLLARIEHEWTPSEEAKAAYAQQRLAEGTSANDFGYIP